MLQQDGVQPWPHNKGCGVAQCCLCSLGHVDQGVQSLVASLANEGFSALPSWSSSSIANNRPCLMTLLLAWALQEAAATCKGK